ncbi:MAG: hypothetical protein ARM1_0609 [Candidatus Micrarchaeota archaeon]|nr:MAG: hypothetical protein ARM1_0609 [Candidatus Micrarchaeota archaeon]
MNTSLRSSNLESSTEQIYKYNIEFIKSLESKKIYLSVAIDIVKQRVKDKRPNLDISKEDIEDHSEILLTMIFGEIIRNASESGILLDKDSTSSIFNRLLKDESFMQTIENICISIIEEKSRGKYNIRTKGFNDSIVGTTKSASIGKFPIGPLGRFMD